MHDGGVVRSNLHSLETRKDARKSGHRHFLSGRSGLRHLPSGTVWTYRLSVWDLNLGVFLPILKILKIEKIKENKCINVTYITIIVNVISLRNFAN